jgi:hypothetical protein
VKQMASPNTTALHANTKHCKSHQSITEHDTTSRDITT